MQMCDEPSKMRTEEKTFFTAIYLEISNIAIATSRAVPEVVSR